MTDIVVNLPNGSRASFPEGTTHEEIGKAINDLLGGGKSVAEGTVSSAAQGLLSGLGDEAKAAVHAAIPGVVDFMNRDLLTGEGDAGVSHAPTFSQRYDENLAKVRASEKQFAEQHPVLDVAGKVGGGVLGAATALPASLTSVGPSAIGNLAKNAAVGAGIGGLTGFGEGEGLEDRLKKAGFGGAVGGVAGAAVRPLANIGRSIAETTGIRQAVSDPLARLGALLRGETGAAAEVSPTAERGAAERLASTFQEDRLTPQIAQQRLTALGPEAIPSDISQSLLQQGVNMKTLRGETRERAQDFFDPFLPASGEEGRNARTGARMIAAAEGSAPPPSHFGAQEGMTGHLRGVGERAYGVMEQAGLKQTPELIEIENNPIVSRAIDNVLNVERATRAGTNRSPASPIEIMHKVKQTIWDMGFDQSTARPGPNMSYYRDLGTEYMNRLKAANPALAAADREYAQAASLPDYYQAGSSVFSKGLGEKGTQGSAPAIADLLTGANSAQTAAARAGTINEIRSRAGDTAGALGLAQKIKTGIGPEGVQTALRTVMPDEAQNLINRAAAERIYANTSQRYLGGPHTADDIAGAVGLGDNLSIRGGKGGIFPRFQEGLKSAVNWVAAPNIEVRNEIGRMLLSANPEEQQRTLALIAQILQQRAAGNATAAGVAGAAGGQAGRIFP